MNNYTATLFSIHLSIVSSYAIEAEKWKPFDVVFEAVFGDLNPFDVPFSALVEGPDGKTMEVPGFYNGNNQWVIRFSANETGKWQLVTQSGMKSLHGKKTTFTCAESSNPLAHGPLHVDANNPHHFRYQDGTVPFLLGYEADFIWALDLGKPTIKTSDDFLDKIANAGFNYMVMNAFAYDTRWCKGKTSDFDFGPAAMLPWEGDTANTDYSRLNVAYWKHFDRVIEALWERGIVAHIMFKVYNKEVKWPEPGSAGDDRYFKYIVDRYAAYPNIIWDFAKEAYYEKNVEYKKNRLEFIRRNDANHHLVTLHDDKEIYKGYYDNLIDFHSDQFHEPTRYENALTQRKYREWPVMNIEFGYEYGPGGPNDKTYNQVQSPEEVIKRAWEISMAGSYCTYYYTNTAWDVIKYHETPVGYSYFKVLSSFFKSINFAGMVPEGKTTDQNGHVVYSLSNKTESVFLMNSPAVNLSEIVPTSFSSGYWLNIYTGGKQYFTSASDMQKPLPEAWKKDALVLYVKK